MPSERQARDALVLEHAGWARGLAIHAIKRRRLLLAPEDAIAVAMLALVGSATRFRTPSKATFRSFAHRHIVGAILDHCYQVGGTDRVVADGGRRRFWPRPIPIADMARELVDPKPSPLERAALGQMLERIAALPPREAHVLIEVYLGDRALADIGREMGISESRACQLAKAGIKRLRGGVEPDAEAK